MIEKELDEKYLMFMFFPNKTCQRGVIQQDAKDKGVEWDTDTEVICITEFRDQMKTLISLKGKKQGNCGNSVTVFTCKLSGDNVMN